MTINMRKVTEAELAPGSVEEEHLADNSVSERTMQDDAVDTASIKAGAVTLAKASDDMKLHQFIGEETEVSVTGTVYEIVKTTNFIKNPNNPTDKLRVLATLKTDDALNTATLAIDIDAVNKIELTSTDIAYEVVSGEFDISALATGKHLIDVKLKSSDAAGIASSDMVDLLIVK